MLFPNIFIHTQAIRIYIDLMEQHLEEYTYDAAIARLSYDVSKASDKVVLKVKGYNQKIPILLRCILQKIKDFQADPKHFEVLKTNVCQLSYSAGFPWLISNSS